MVIGEPDSVWRSRTPNNVGCGFERRTGLYTKETPENIRGALDELGLRARDLNPRPSGSETEGLNGSILLLS